jgi:hypothetical protein
MTPLRTRLSGHPLRPVQPPAVDSTSGSSDSAKPAEMFPSAPRAIFSLPSSSPSATRTPDEAFALPVYLNSNKVIQQLD